MKIINITHSDMDGAVCAILMKEFCNQKKYDYEVHKATYNNVDDVFKDHYKNEKDKLYVITDITLQNEPSFIGDVDNILLIDHHPKKEPSKIKKQIVKSDEGESGCRLVYGWANKMKVNYNDKFTKMMELGHDYDTFTLSMATSRALNYLYYFYFFERFVDRFKSGFDKFTNDELTFLKCKNAQIKEVLTNVEISAINDSVAFLIAEDHMNEIAEDLYTNKGFKYVFIYSPKRKSLSMRCHRDAIIHCGEFLAIYGGGGHRCAGGVVINDDKKVQEVLSGFELVYDEYHPPF